MVKKEQLAILVLICAAISLYAIFDRYLIEPMGYFFLSLPAFVGAYLRVGKKIDLPRAVVVIFILVLIFLLNYSIFKMGVYPEDGLVWFMAILILAKSFMLCKFNDYHQLMFLSALSILTAGIHHPTSTYSFLLIAYTLIAGYILYQIHLANETLSHHQIRTVFPAVVVSNGYSHWFLSFLGVGAATWFSALLIFQLLPRQSPDLKFSYLHERQETVTGFSQDMTLGRMAMLLQDPTPVLRLKLMNDDRKSYLEHLYLRGMVLTHYVRQGNEWKWIESFDDSEYLVKSSSPSSSNMIIQAPRSSPDDQMLWRISFEQSIASNLFVIDRPVSISVNRPVALSYLPNRNMISVKSGFPRRGFTYHLLTEQSVHDVEPNYGHSILPEAPTHIWRSSMFNHRFEDTSGGDTSHAVEHHINIVDLEPFKPIARSIVEGLGAEASLENQVRRIEGWLRLNYQYSSDNTDVDRSVEPTLDFLVRRKHGHCVYFASAMALLARSLGLDAHVVVGYKGGVYNSFGDYHVIRNHDAHAWAEVYIPEKGWVRCDPTPAARDMAMLQEDTGIIRWFWDLVDMAQYKWDDVFTGENVSSAGRDALRHRQIIADSKTPGTAVQSSPTSWIDSLKRIFESSEYDTFWFKVLRIAIITAAIIFTAAFARILYVVAGIVRKWLLQYLHRRWEQRFGSLWHCPISFYRRLLLWLATRGLTRSGTETAQEFVDRVGKLYPHIDRDMRLITDSYLAVRFGNRTMTSKQQNRIHTAAKRIKTILSGKKGVGENSRHD